MKKANHRSVFAFSMMALLLFSSQAQAYIPPAWFQIKSLSNNRSAYKTLTVRSSVTDGSQTLSLLTQVDTKDQKLETYVLDSQGKEQFAVSRSFAEPIAFTESAASVVLLFENRFDFMVRGLRAAGIPVALPNDKDPANAEASQLVRINGKIAYRVGSETTLQVAIEKDSFLPLQIKRSNGVSIDFLNYRLYRFVSFPRQIRVSQSAQTLLTEDIKDVQVDGATIAHTITPDSSSIPADGIAKTVFQWLR